MTQTTVQTLPFTVRAKATPAAPGFAQAAEAQFANADRASAYALMLTEENYGYVVLSENDVPVVAWAWGRKVVDL